MTEPSAHMSHDASVPEAEPYHTPVWGWIAILIAVAMIVGLIAIVVLNLDAAAAAG